MGHVTRTDIDSELGRSFHHAINAPTVPWITWHSNTTNSGILYFLLTMVKQPPVGQGLLIIDDSRSHSDTPHSVGLLWTSGQPVAETSTRQNTTLTTDRHPCPRRDWSPQSQQASGRRPTP